MWNSVSFNLLFEVGGHCNFEIDQHLSRSSSLSKCTILVLLVELLRTCNGPQKKQKATNTTFQTFPTHQSPCCKHPELIQAPYWKSVLTSDRTPWGFACIAFLSVFFMVIIRCTLKKDAFYNIPMANFLPLQGYLGASSSTEKSPQAWQTPSFAKFWDSLQDGTVIDQSFAFSLFLNIDAPKTFI